MSFAVVVTLVLLSSIEKSQKTIVIFFVMALLIYIYNIKYPRVLMTAICLFLYLFVLKSEMLLLTVVLLWAVRLARSLSFFSMCLITIVLYVLMWKLFEFYSIEVSGLIFFLEGANLWRIFSNIYVIECFTVDLPKSILGIQTKACGEPYLQAFWRESQTFINNFYISDGATQGILFRLVFEYGIFGIIYGVFLLAIISSGVEEFERRGHGYFRDFLCVIMLIALFFQSWFGNPIFWTVCAIIFGTCRTNSCFWALKIGRKAR